MKDLAVFGLSISPWVYSPAIYFFWVSLLLITRRFLFNRLQKLAQMTASKMDDLFVDSLELPLTLLIFASGLLVVDAASPLVKAHHWSRYFLLTFNVTVVIALIFFLDKLLKGVLQYYGPRIAFLHTSGKLIHGVARVIVLGLGVMMLMDSFGISITPLVASLGIGSLAVALALQPTLENFFSGVQLVVDKPIRVGDFIRLDSGEEGFVEMIGWRSTWIRLPTNNMVVIPNKILVNSRVLNYYYPSREATVTVPVGVHYNSDLSRVERITEEVARETLKAVTGGVPDFPAFIRYQKFNDSSIDLVVILRAKEFPDGSLVIHEFIKRLHARYAKEGIVIPYPIQAVNTSQEHADPSLTRKF